MPDPTSTETPASTRPTEPHRELADALEACAQLGYEPVVTKLIADLQRLRDRVDLLARAATYGASTLEAADDSVIGDMERQQVARAARSIRKALAAQDPAAGKPF